ncbi:MAG: hypothetical protein R2771_09515 [Saprospiraceae bacterium]
METMIFTRCTASNIEGGCDLYILIIKMETGLFLRNSIIMLIPVSMNLNLQFLLMAKHYILLAIVPEVLEERIYGSAIPKMEYIGKLSACLDTTINTKFDERAHSYITVKYIVFYLQWKNKLGGTDIYKPASKIGNKWSDVQNLGYPLNTENNGKNILKPS